MDILNRSAVVLRPKQPYLEWARLDDEEGLADVVFETLRSEQVESVAGRSRGPEIGRRAAEELAPLFEEVGTTFTINLELDSPEARDRTFRYCAVWDNGATDPQKVRKHSGRPDANTCAFGDFTDFIGQCGCEPEDRACLGGPNQGMICNGEDAVCGDGGVCDACPVWGGVTTEEEMFAVLGAYYVID